MVTASHNPPDYNGMKFVREQARPISADTGLMRDARADRARPAAGARPHSTGSERPLDIRAEVPRAPARLRDGCPRSRKLKVVVNAGQRRCGPHHRCARTAPAVRVHQGQPRARRHLPATACPTRCSRRTAPPPRTSCVAAVRMWDWPGMATTTAASSSTRAGGSSRATTWWACWPRPSCSRSPAARIVHDPRLTWNTLDIVQRCGGTPVLCKSGHAFIKQKMREVDAVYGGEMSAHHYFRRFAYCDSGMIPWLLVLAVISERGQPLSALVGERMRLFPASGEINRHLAADTTIDPGTRARALRAAGAGDRSHRRPVDGIRSSGASTCAAPTPSRWCG